MPIKRLLLIARGQVQGVGFRPFVWKLAHSLNLTGFCGNTSEGVVIEIQGESLEEFCARLERDKPPLAAVSHIDGKYLAPVSGETDFVIKSSGSGQSKGILVAPDVAVCDDCLAELHDPANSRHNYPFINCVNCGPRFSVTRSLPYDRPNTVMECFPMCDDCRSQYENPGDRRFHAQPIACEKCGPSLWLVEKGQERNSVKTEANSRDALKKAAKLLRDGKILAVKGLGGFQLACDARNHKAVQRLRQLKNRPAKAFAVMTDNLDSVHKFARPTELQKKLLQGREKPITLCIKADTGQAPLASGVSPDSLFTGVMLPYTPLHHLLFEELKNLGLESPVLVMTSANPAGEPICLGNREAIRKLGHMTDAWLLHNRDILVRVDDSVVFTGDNPVIVDAAQGALLPEKTSFLRRARGYAPRKIDLPDGPNVCVFGAGAELKNTFCLTRENEAFVSQHIGDLSTPQTLDFFQSALDHLQKLLETDVGLVVHDLHPNFLSTRFAQDFARDRGLPAVALQHHAAHAAALLCENNCLGNALVVALDGIGLGENNDIRGGEFIYMQPEKAQWQRVGAFQRFPLPGGDAATQNPWRIARALSGDYAPPAAIASPRALAIVDEMLAKNVNAPLTGSCGRLFDGISALLGFCPVISYEGQAPMRLETAAREWLAHNSAKHLPNLDVSASHAVLPELNVVNLAQNIGQLAKNGESPKMLAAAFHWNLAKGAANFAGQLARQCNTDIIGLTGGVMANSLLLSLLWQNLTALGFKPLLHKELPAGDGGLSLGQAFWGRLLLANGKI